MTETATLTGAEKVAIVLMSIERDSAVEVMKQFTEQEAGEITAEIMRMRKVEPALAHAVLSEFRNLSYGGSAVTRGGRDLAVGLLEASFGSERAAGVMGRVASSMAGKAFEFLEVIEPAQVPALLDGELPETIALVLAHMRPDRASTALGGFEEAMRTDVAQCIATMGTATPEAVALVAETLKVRAGAVVAPRDPVEVVGGVQPLVEIINRADISTEKALLDGLEERDPQLAEEVRSRMLTFADIVKFERRDVQQVLRGIDTTVLAIAMKGSSEPVIEVIRGNLSERNRELLDDEIAVLGPMRVSQVEEARAEIVRSIRDLEAQGAITVQRGDEDELVY